MTRRQAGEAAQPRQGKRLGPRPLPLHLLAATLAWRSSKLAWPLLRQGWPASPGARPGPNPKPDPSAGLPPNPLLSLLHNPPFAALAQSAAALPPESLERALEAEIAGRARRLLDGIETYQAHPYRRALKDPPALWQEGTTRLLDYRGVGESGPVAEAAGPPILLIPSLVNRGYILDLMPGRSFARWLAAPAGGGLRPFLLDWGAPGETERGFSLTDYVCGRLETALERVRAETGQAPLVLGYCMGGLLALALALRRQEEIAGLILLATPWDFHAEAPEGAAAAADPARLSTETRARRLAALLLPLAPLLEGYGALPADVVQGLFSLLDPLTAVKKFLSFARLDPASAKAAAFVALEDWLNDGVALAAPVAREALGGWYGENSPARGAWRIAGRVVDPTAFRKPALVIVPSADRIVPPASALALARAIPGARVEVPALGHIGMMVSGGAREKVWGRVG